MLESNPPRNSQPETHPDDERGRWPQGWRLHRMERFPDTSENPYIQKVAAQRLRF